MQPREPTVNSHRRDRAKPSHRCNCDMLMESAAPRLLPLAAAGFTGYHNCCNLIHLHIHCHQVFHGEFFRRRDGWRKHPLLTSNLRQATPGLGIALVAFGIYLVGEQVYNRVIAPSPSHSHHTHHQHSAASSSH
ncbi:hypothetical protein WN943_005754 [Citrus x changshan-huyou]